MDELRGDCHVVQTHFPYIGEHVHVKLSKAIIQ